ncbi:MAG: glycoside hydrolase family 30 beta sandwich domain-containing protein [Lachnospiraceae bacterium]|nr:glycoside hydrolase family 30 beta sandwich domain-containing protein [Lachnospiraceae bacterium]
MQFELHTTTFKNNVKEEIETKLPFLVDEGKENEVVNLYPEITYQEIQGFGGALTDSAGYVYSLMTEVQKKEMLKTYFGEDGLRYRIARIHIDSCDFSLEHYEAMSDKKDVNMDSFDLGRAAKYIFPLLEDAQKACPTPIEIMLTPWSPPAFMKTNGERNNGGKLKDEFREFWANYICRYIEEFRARGYKVTRLSVQNEPKAKQIWDSCEFTAEEEKSFLRDYLYPTMQKRNLADVELFVWDHNKERLYERARDIIDADTDKMIAGIAFHWYSGDHFDAIRLVKEQFPDKILVLSEACIEYCKYGKDDYLANAQKYAHDMIGNLNNGMQAFYDWNILLDEQGGPNHVGNFCDAPYLYDTKKGELLERNTLAYVKHFSQYLLPGAKQIAHTTYNENVETTAFINPDKSISVILLNRTGTEMNVNVRLQGKIVAIVLPAQAIATGVITSSL